MNIKLVPIEREEEHIFQNMSQYYIYEFSRFLDFIELNDEGEYDPFTLKDYWNNPKRHPFFVKAEGRLAGFVLVSTGTEDEDVHSISEFFIMQKYNGKGIGKKAAVEVFDRFPGKWKIFQVEKNYPAQAFWRSVINKYTDGNYREWYDEKRRSFQEFEN